MSNKITLTLSTIPPLLRAIPSPPKQLFVKGVPLGEITQRPRIAIVGSRKVTPYGTYVTELFAAALAKQGIVIVSGLAFGIDSLAHRAALQAGGLTVAVLPTGLDTIYPRSHYALAGKIVKQGALITEYEQGTNAYKGNFIARNRLISGLSDLILIPEAGASSGTLHTAQFAHLQGKQLAVVPGNITSDMSAGTNELLKQGASPVTEPADIIRMLGLEQSAQQQIHDNIIVSSEEQHILNTLRQGAASTSELTTRCDISIQQCNQLVTLLEINGLIRANGNGVWEIIQRIS